MIEQFEDRCLLGSLELIIAESAGPTIPITDNGALDTDPTVGVINVNTTLLNLSLVNYQFTALGSNSNSPGTAAIGFLSQNGTAQLHPRRYWVGHRSRERCRLQPAQCSAGDHAQLGFEHVYQRDRG